MGTTIEQLRRILATHAPKLSAFSPENTRVRAAVAIIGRESRQGDDVEFLYIRRSEFDGDPWSGDIAFPGGRIDGPDELPRHAAERETLEEVGIDLGSAEYLGQIDDVTGSSEAVLVSGFVYCVDGEVEVRANHEVAATRWVGIEKLADPARRTIRHLRWLEHDVDMPALEIFDDGSPVLWGLTYRFTELLMAMLSRPIPSGPWRRDGVE